jgi:Family of unknown function (DUF6252)
MKKLLLLLCTTFLLSSCDRDGQIFAGKDQLPPETQTGANTVGCLVNGKVFLPKKEGISPEVNCFYQLVDGEYYFSISFSDRTGANNTTVNVFTKKISLKVGSNYVLNKPDNTILGSGGEYRESQLNQYNTNKATTGELKITKLDPTNSIISGTFWFDAVNSAGEVVQIREGRFDWRYKLKKINM